MRIPVITNGIDPISDAALVEIVRRLHVDASERAVDRQAGRVTLHLDFNHNGQLREWSISNSEVHKIG